MAVYAAERTESKLQLLTDANNLRRDLKFHILNDFAIDGKLKYEEEWHLAEIRKNVLNECRNISICLTKADKIYATKSWEFETRIELEEEAILSCAALQAELNFIVDTYHSTKINTNKYTKMALRVSNIQGKIVNLQKHDKKRLKTKLKQDDESLELIMIKKEYGFKTKNNHYDITRHSIYSKRKKFKR